MMICPSCGKTVNDANKYCNFCGVLLPASAPATRPDVFAERQPEPLLPDDITALTPEPVVYAGSFVTPQPPVAQARTADAYIPPTLQTAPQPPVFEQAAEIAPPPVIEQAAEAAPQPPVAQARTADAYIPPT
ncbi:MAG: hypothetical protein Q4B96_07745, partial [Bacillota bacterium]|nr:hypothetical protein [Bacillota bacterium]